MPDTAPTVVILAGGSNSRFWPLRAKSLVSFGGRTLLERQITAFAATGCHRFVVVANAETVDGVNGLPPLGVAVTVAVQQEPRGMGDAVLAAADARPELQREPFIVAQAHDVVEPSLYERFVTGLDTAGAGGLLTGQRVTEHFPGGYLALDGDRVVELVEKPAAGSEPSDIVNLVLHFHARPAQLLEQIRAAYADASTADDHYERAIAALLPHYAYRVLRYDGPWRPVKYPWHVLGVMELLLRDLPTLVNPPEGVSGAVLLEDGVRILPGARVVGPAWIGAGTLIGNNSLVRGSMIGRGVEIGYGCEVARSHVGDGCTFHHNYAGDSVIDRNVGLGFGTVTGNWPFYPPPVRSTVSGARVRTGMDKFGAVIGAHSRTGIGVLLNPGVKIGARTFVGPGVVVSRDIPDGRLVLVKQELRDEPNPFR